MLAAQLAHHVTGLDIALAVIVALAAWVLLTKVAPKVPWFELATLFGVALLVFALLARW